MTTMYGSVDDITNYTEAFIESNTHFKLHVDVYGGFIILFRTKTQNLLLKMNTFLLSSGCTQNGATPYGTGIFLIRKT